MDFRSALLSSAHIGEAVRTAGDLLQGVNIDTARLDARVLACRAFDLSPEELMLRSESVPDTASLGLLFDYCVRRSVGVPVARILGTKEFWSLEFDLNDATLVPRPETELCVETGLDLLRLSVFDRPRILDLGTGSGCILISLLHEFPDATGIGIDLARQAIKMARQNAGNLGVSGRAEFECRSWDKGNCFENTFELIVTNPPYIPLGDIRGLATEVRDYDPVLALSGGEDGLDAYRRIADLAPGWLSPGGFLLAEVGQGQDGDVAGLFQAAGLCLTEDCKCVDLAGNVRIVVAKKR